MQSVQSEGSLILIAERDHNVRALQSFFLTRDNFQVVFADDGEQALAQARLTPPSLIITEILIPRLDGLALCRQLRADPRTAGIPVIVFSMLAAAQRASEAGANAFLRKPLVESLFMAAVQNAILPQLATRETQWASK